MKLLAPSPGWTARADVIVVGSGIAGLTTALQCRTYGLTVLLVTKASVDEGSTKWAQGGIAAALGDGDSPEAHEKDTLVAGAGLCDVDAVRVLVTEGPEAVRKLIERGAIFDKEASGEIALTREGGHLRNRILHAGGDATGAEVSRALLAAVHDDPSGRDRPAKIPPCKPNPPLPQHPQLRAPFPTRMRFASAARVRRLCPCHHPPPFSTDACHVPSDF